MITSFPRPRALLAPLLVLASLAVSPIPAQQQLAEETVSATLAAEQDVAEATDEAVLTLAVNFKTDAEVDATLLSGVYLDVFVGERPLPTVLEATDGRVKVAKGARIERELRVELGPLLEEIPNRDENAVTMLTFRWPGIPGASKTITVVPKQSDIDIDQLDLAQTKVRMITSKGSMLIGFRPDKAPNHVRNFVKLSKEGFYNGTRFHRVIRNFMVQGGCPNTKVGATGRPGTGSPGYTINAEFNDIKHERGIVSMARMADPNSAGCQFFLMHGAAPHLDNSYTAFGQIEDGLDTLDALASTPVGPAGREVSAPLEDLWLHAAIVIPAYE